MFGRRFPSSSLGRPMILVTYPGRRPGLLPIGPSFACAAVVFLACSTLALAITPEEAHRVTDQAKRDVDAAARALDDGRRAEDALRNRREVLRRQRDELPRQVDDARKREQEAKDKASRAESTLPDLR